MRKKILVIIFVNLLLLVSLISIVSAKSIQKIDIINYEAPETPIITGDCKAEFNVPCQYDITSTDHQRDKIYYVIKCSDDPSIIIETKYYDSGETLEFIHCWCTFYQRGNPYVIRAKAIDDNGFESEWARFEVECPCSGSRSTNPIVESFFYHHPLLYKIFIMVKNLK